MLYLPMYSLLAGTYRSWTDPRGGSVLRLAAEIAAITFTGVKE